MKDKPTKQYKRKTALKKTVLIYRTISTQNKYTQYRVKRNTSMTYRQMQDYQQNDINTQRKRNCGCSTAYKDEQLPDEINGYKIVKDLRTINGRRTVLVQCPLCAVNTYPVLLTSLKTGNVKAHCGCKPKKRYIKKPKVDKPLPKYKHPMYFTWDSMIARCTRPSSPKYVNYGARGITVCDRWMQSFDAFVSDMGAKPTPQHSIDRINNDGNYEPSNCKWSTQKEQQNNKRNNKPK